MVLADSHGISRVPRYSGTCPARQHAFVYGAVTLSGRSFQTVQLACCYGNSPALRPDRPYNPTVQARWFGLCPRSLAATSEIEVSFSSWRYLDVSVPSVRFTRPMNSAGDDGAFPPPGFPIRKSPGQSVFAAHRSLSQLTTSFIAFWRQGIHHPPLVA